MPEFYAHTKEGRPPSDWQPLEEHLKNVAEKAKEFAEAFGAGDWGYLAGLWHDLGKPNGIKPKTERRCFLWIWINMK